MKRKLRDGSRVIGKEGKEGDEGKACFRGRKGTVAGYLAGSGYLVKLDDGLDEYVYAHWLEAAPPPETRHRVGVPPSSHRRMSNFSVTTIPGDTHTTCRA